MSRLLFLFRKVYILLNEHRILRVLVELRTPILRLNPPFKLCLLTFNRIHSCRIIIHVPRHPIPW